MIIYIITNKINDKRYIGQTKKTAEFRFKKHKEDALIQRRGYALHAAIRKYGIDSFSIRILCRRNNLDEANHREAYYIELLKTRAPNGYNIRPGGDNSPMAEETKIKLSKIMSGENHHFFNKSFSEIHKKNLSLANRGKKHGPMSQETKTKISKAHSGKSPSGEHRKNLSKALKGIPLTKERKENIRKAFWKSPSAQSRINRLIQEGLKTAKSVLCHQNGNVYPSIHRAARELGLQRQHIKGTIDGKCMFTKGYSFEYVK